MELSDAQKDLILNNWDKMSFAELVQKTFNNDSLDGRTAEGRIIKTFLGTKRPKTSEWIKREVTLSEENKEFIQNNPQMNAMEIAKVIFNNPNLEPLSKEFREVKRYRDILNIITEKEADTPENDYKPPSHLIQVVKKVNDSCQKELKLETMPTIQKKAMESLKGFLHSPRFIQMMNSYVSKKSRKLFEEEFIRSTFDKPDLSSDELNLYVNLCSNYVMMITLNRQKDLLDERFERDVQDTSKGVSQALAEMIKAKTDEINKCDRRQSDLINDLNGKRSVRIKEQKGSATNIANLFEWWKDEVERQKALQWAEIRRKEVEMEVDRLESIEEMKARVLGISKSELIHG
jgi:hypothetical protein